MITDKLVEMTDAFGANFISQLTLNGKGQWVTNALIAKQEWEKRGEDIAITGWRVMADKLKLRELFGLSKARRVIAVKGTSKEAIALIKAAVERVPKKEEPFHIMSEDDLA